MTKPASTNTAKPEGLFDRIKATLKAKSPSIVDLQRALNEARQLHDDALRDRAWLEEQRREMLLASEPDRAKHKADLIDAGERIADLVLFVDEISKRLVMAEKAQEHARRLAVYSEAEARAAAAGKLYRQEWAPACTKLVAVLRAFAEAELAIAEANAALPTGATPIGDAEITTRGTQGFPRRVIKTDEVSLWCFEDTATPVGDDAQKRVVVRSHGRGYVPPSGAGSLTVGGSMDVVLRQFRRTTFLPEVFPHSPDRLALATSLPGFYQAQTLSPFGVDHGAVIAEIEAALLMGAGQHAEEPRRPQTTLEVLSDAHGVIAEEAA